MATLKTKFKVYSVRSKEEGSPVKTIGLNAVRDIKDDETSFGAKTPWGELVIDAEAGSDAVDAFQVGDVVTLTIKHVEKAEEPADSDPNTDAKPKK